MRTEQHMKIVDTKEEADKLIAELDKTHYSLFLEKTNKGNKKIGPGKFKVSWGAPRKTAKA